MNRCKRTHTARQQGFTLVEIIVAIALLGIIAMGFLAAMAGQFSMMTKMRKMTKDTFAAQQKMEREIESVKQSVEAGTALTGEVSITLFDEYPPAQGYLRTVKAYERETVINDPPLAAGSNRTLYTMVADDRPQDFAVASVTSDTVTLKRGASTFPVSYWDLGGLYVDSSTTISDPGSVNRYLLHKWYVSREGFHIPVRVAPAEIETGSVYPRFPDDYVLIPGENSEDLTALQASYAGRHIIHNVTPASNSGKMGNATQSTRPVFLSGLPMTDQLRVHYDASMLDESDVSDSGTTTVLHRSGTDLFVQRWFDAEGIGLGSGHANEAVQTAAAAQPGLKRMMIGQFLGADGIVHDSFARYAVFSGSQRMSVANESTVNFSRFTLYLAFRSTETTNGKSFIAKIGDTASMNRSWRVGLVADNTLGIRIVDQSGASDVLAADAGEGLDGDWHVLRVTVGDSSEGDSKLVLQIDDGIAHEMSRTAGPNIWKNTSDSVLELGGDRVGGNARVDIGEVAIYEKALSATDADTVYKYFDDKYHPIAPSIAIYSMRSSSAVVGVGEAFSLPMTMTANMTNGTNREVAVNWSDGHTSGETITPTVPGVLRYTAAAVDAPGKTAVFEVTVLGIQSVDALEETLDVGTLPAAYALPATAAAQMANGTVRNVGISWPANAKDAIQFNTVGDYVVTGFATGAPTVPAVLTVHIVPTRATGVTLNKSETALYMNATEDLTETVLPSSAADKRVTWTSSNNTVATVNASGLVRGLNEGTATITVTTVNGGYTAQCIVHVLVPVNGVSLSPSSATVNAGGTVALTATVQPLNATIREVSWSSSNPAVATVSTTGLVTAVGSGSATITVTTVDGGKTATSAITVKIPVTGVSLNYTSGEMRVGETTTLVATISPTGATNRNLIWTSSNTSVLTVSSSGLVTAKSSGNATVTVRTEDGGHTATCTVRVNSSGGCGG